MKDFGRPSQVLEVLALGLGLLALLTEAVLEGILEVREQQWGAIVTRACGLDLLLVRLIDSQLLSVKWDVV